MCYTWKLNVVICCLIFIIISISGELQVQSVIKCIETPPKASQNFILKFLLCTACVCETLAPYSYISIVELEILISVYTDCKHRIQYNNIIFKNSMCTTCSMYFRPIISFLCICCVGPQLNIDISFRHLSWFADSY